MIDRYRKSLTIIGLFMDNTNYFSPFMANSTISTQKASYEFLVTI